MDWLRGRVAPSATDKSLGRDLTVLEAKNKVRSFKGQLTSDVGAASRSIVYADANPSPQAIYELQRSLDNLRYHVEWIEVLNVYLGFMDAANIATYEAATLDVVHKYEEARDELISSISQHGAVIAPPAKVAAAPSVSATTRVQTALMPDTLRRDSTPSELNVWAREFKAFFSVSKLEACTLIVQQAYLLKCLDMELSNMIRLSANDKMVIFGQTDSCMALLVNKFAETYPVFLRRRQFFDYSQKSGQSWDDFATGLDLLGGEADLSGLKTEDILIFRLIGGCTDTFLREKFLKMKSPTLAELKKEATEWEGVRRSMGASKLKSVKDDQSYAQKQTRYSKGKGTNPNQPSANNDAHQSGKCKRCGYPPHSANGPPCPAKERTCDRCGEKGHFAFVRGGPNSGAQICTRKPRERGSEEKQGGKKKPNPSQRRRERQRKMQQEEANASSASGLKPEWSVTNYDNSTSRFTALRSGDY